MNREWTGPVSGRAYTSSRPRGFANWKPRLASRELVGQVSEVLARYTPPLTVRQIFYRLVAVYLYEKTEAAYEKLIEVLIRARRSGMIPFEAIRDDGITVSRETAYGDPTEFLQWTVGAALGYRRPRWQGQAKRIEVWVEAAGMVPQVERVAFSFGAEVYSSGGFESLTAKYAAAKRIDSRAEPTVVLFVGDFDASGLSRMDAAADDVTAFCKRHEPMWEHAVVTPEQIDRYRLPTAPGKEADRAGGGMTETVQAEALAPDELAAELRAALEPHVDLQQLADVEAQGGEDRGRLVDLMRDTERRYRP